MLDLVVTNCQEKIVRITDGGRLGRSDHNIITVEIMAEIKNKEDYIQNHCTVQQMDSHTPK